MDTPPISEAFYEIANLAERLGVKDINVLPGCWEFRLDDQWWIAVNGRKEAVKCSTGVMVEPVHAYVEYNGWPAGVLTPYGGVIAAGSAANEQTFIDALKNAGRDTKGGV